jgi:hypothetical protein
MSWLSPVLPLACFVPLCEGAWLEIEVNSQDSSRPESRANQGSRSASA